METQLRLADRRGLLSGGRPLSSVQHYGLSILMMLDAKQRSQDWLDRLRVAILSDHLDMQDQLFPEWVKARAERKAAEPQPAQPTGIADIDLAAGQVDWQTPASDAEKQALEEWINNRSGQVSGAVLNGGEWT